MAVQPVGNEIQRHGRLKSNVRSAVESGVLSVGLSYLFFSKGLKSAMKSSLGTEDAFVSKTLNSARKAAEAAGESVDAKSVCEKARASFPKVYENGRNALKCLGKTFVMVTAGVFVGNIIADKFFRHD